MLLVDLLTNFLLEHLNSYLAHQVVKLDQVLEVVLLELIFLLVPQKEFLVL